MENLTELFCKTCSTVKSIARFEKRIRLGNRKYSECMDCKNLKRNTEAPEKRALRLEQRKVLYQKNPQKFIDQSTKSKYGYSSLDRERLLTEQNNLCKICSTDIPGGRGWCLDHDHNSKEIRGVLCHSCNLMLGHSKDNIDILKKAIEYLSKGTK